jgi:hypothetical protein
MNHKEALRDMAAERYLLGELTEEPREAFEEHLFECSLCAADLTSGVAFLQAARAELAAPARLAAPASVAKPGNGLSRLRGLLSPAWLVPALAASLLTIAYQSAVVLPTMRQQLAQADSPEIINNLVLTGGATRGGSMPHITAAEHGSFVLSVDIAAQSTYSAYLCSLYAPSGALVWHGTVTPQQANDTVLIRLPSAITRAGENILLVQGVRQGSSSGANLDDLARHSFVLELHN